MKTLLLYFLIPFMMIGFCILLGGIIALKDYYSKQNVNTDFSDLWESLTDSGIVAFICCCIVGGIGLFLLWGISNDKDKELAELDKKAYNICKVHAPTKTYQAGGKNFVVIDRKVYQVTDEDYGLFTVNKKCR